jgi:hypothetical protein
MNSFSTDVFRFELTSSSLLITIVKDATQVYLDPSESLILTTFLRKRRRSIRREQRRLERQGGASYSILGLEGFKTSTHQFEFLSGWLSIFDLQRDVQMSFDPFHVIQLDDFIRAHQGMLVKMPQDPEVPEYFHYSTTSTIHMFPI